MSSLDFCEGPELESPSVIVKQPGQKSEERDQNKEPVFMAVPQLIPGVPRGLEYLASVSSIAVHQLVENLEVFLDFETKNRYSLRNQLGQQVYFAYEKSSLAGRMCMDKNRSFTMHIVDNLKNPVMLIRRPTSLMTFDDQCIVECPPGEMIGRVYLQSSCYCCSLEYTIQNKEGTNKLFIRGPGTACAGGEINYQITSANNGAPMGAITKKWGGFLKEMSTDADTFIVNFPVNLDFHLKSSLLAATFLIDFIAYENNHQ